MKFIVDRIEENIVVCENIDTKEIIQISINEIPENIKEGNVIYYDGNSYIKDEEEENKIRKRIVDKMNKLWK